MGRELTGATANKRETLSRLQVSQRARSQAPQRRHSIKEYVLPYEQLSTTLQKINQRGCQILSIANA